MKNTSTTRTWGNPKHNNQNFRKKGFSMKGVISLALVLVTMVTVFSAFSLTASAAPLVVMNASNTAEFKATKTVPVYRDSTFTTRGSSSPAQSYAAELWSGDTCNVVEFGYNYLKVTYPTSSGTRTGYVKIADVMPPYAWYDCTRFYARVQCTTYWNTSGSYYGYIAVNDECYWLGKVGSYHMFIYAARSGNRAWKIGYITDSDFYRI